MLCGFVPAATPGLVKSAVMLISMSIWLPLRAGGSLRGTLAPALRAVEAIAIGLPAGQQGDADPSAQNHSVRAVATCCQRRPKAGRHGTFDKSSTGQPELLPEQAEQSQSVGTKAWAPAKLLTFRRDLTPERLQLWNCREHQARLIRRIDPHLPRQRLDRRPVLTSMRSTTLLSHPAPQDLALLGGIVEGLGGVCARQRGRECQDDRG